MFSVSAFRESAKNGVRKQSSDGVARQRHHMSTVRDLFSSLRKWKVKLSVMSDSL